MGIVNATPDSFSDGGKFLDISKAIQHISLMKDQGATIIDIGGESTRPGSEPVSELEELKRVIPILEKAVLSFPKLVFSIDTTKPEVARRALQVGASIVNDVSGLQKEKKLGEIAADFDAYYVIMHSQGNPKTMQENPTYTDVVGEVQSFFERQISLAKKLGVQNIILDPGIGFGKNLEQNLKLLAHLDKFTKFGFPILIGASRKSMIGSILNEPVPENRIIGTVAVHYDTLTKGARILRVHDVKQASDSIRIFNAIKSQR